MARQKKEQYGTGHVSYVVNQRPLTDAEKAQILEKLEGATSVSYMGHALFTNVRELYVGNVRPNREILAAVEQLLHENGWELKWTKKRKPRQPKRHEQLRMGPNPD